MKRVALLVCLLVALMTVACGKQEQTQAPEEKKAAETTAAVVPQAEEKAVEAASTTESVAQNPTPAVEQANETDKAAGVSQTLTKTTETVTQQATETSEAATQTVAQATVAPGAAAVAESVVIEASYGKVTLSHKMHADAFGCAACHGDGTPGALELGKDKAHALCKGCHQEKAAGPTKCAGCHVK